MKPDFQVIVIGAGHAGCEAALASARCGAKTLLISLNLDTIAWMPCNPSIGGQGKGQLVREIDALGGEMGIIADETTIQARLLNTRKGLAVQSLRVQCDKVEYSRRMISSILTCPGLEVAQGLVTELILDENKIIGVRLASGDTIKSNAIVVTTGTFLRGLIHIGKACFPAGRAGEPPAEALGKNLAQLGFPVRRFKTGTPPRVHVKSINFEGLEKQEHEPESPPFSLRSHRTNILSYKPCFITRTNKETHEIIRRHMSESALFGGRIKGTGPRYCPSIEDKVNKFPEKESHKVFLEPEGANSSEIYLQGLSTSLPEHVQEMYVRSIQGLNNAQITRPGYAIEYDIVDPTFLFPTLEYKTIRGLFFAGQVNGTSGYEEAAAQGLLAGINAAAFCLEKPAIVLSAEESFTGLMIEEITSNGVIEPYRIFTSRSPFRLNLRMSNAEDRLSQIGKSVGLISESRWKEITERRSTIERIISELNNKSINANDLPSSLRNKLGNSYSGSSNLAQILRRPEISLRDISEILPEIYNLDRLAEMETEVRIKYEGYFVQQERENTWLREFQNTKIPEEFIENLPSGLSFEAKLRIKAVRPVNFGDLKKIPGLRASDIAVVLMWLRKNSEKND